MILFRFKNFSVLDATKPQKPKTLNTSGNVPGFNKDRNYDQDFNRLGRLRTTRELSRTNALGEEMKKLNTELNEGRKGKWLDT
jgi:hypothetical protein